VRERIDARDFGREGGVEDIAVGKTLRLGDGADDLGVGGEVEPWGYIRLRFAAIGSTRTRFSRPL